MWVSSSTTNGQEAFPERKRLKYKQHCWKLKDESSMTLNYVQLADSITTIAELLDSPIYNFVTLDENDCGYEGKTEYLIVNYVHPLSLKATAAASQADNPN